MYFDPSYKVHCSVDATDNDKCFEWVSDRGEIAADPKVLGRTARQLFKMMTVGKYALLLRFDSL
jgi:hypothetical protein